MTDETERELVLRREIPFPRELVWKAVTDPAHASRWWGPNGFSCGAMRMDFRIGGAWIFEMMGPDGTHYPNRSVFKDIVPPSKLVFDHGDGKNFRFETAITLAEAAGGTLITHRQLYETKAFRDEAVGKHGAADDGKQHLARLEAYIQEHLTR